MPITCFPDEMKPRKTVVCALCSKEIPLARATAGLLDAGGNQVFACNDHFWHGHDYIIGWIDFGIVKQAKLLDRGELTPPGALIQDWGNDWSVY